MIGRPLILGILVDIDETGKVTGARVVMRSAAIDDANAQKAFDEAALAAATSSQYAPKIVNCVPVKSRYIFKVTFNPRG